MLDGECCIFENGNQGSDLSGRVTDLIDVVKDQQQNYVPEVIVIIIIIRILYLRLLSLSSTSELCT